jgi:hypothetical protein
MGFRGAGPVSAQTAPPPPGHDGLDDAYAGSRQKSPARLSAPEVLTIAHGHGRREAGMAGWGVTIHRARRCANQLAGVEADRRSGSLIDHRRLRLYLAWQKER